MGSIATCRPNGFDARWPFAAAVLLLLASACYAPLGQRAVDSREIYRESGFSRESLRNEGVALLPPRLSFGHETYGPPLLQGLAETLGDALAPDGLVHPNLSASRINQAGVADDYLAMLADYDETGILDRSQLATVSEAVGARYFGMPTLVDFREGTNARTRFARRPVRPFRISIETHDEDATAGRTYAHMPRTRIGALWAT